MRLKKICLSISTHTTNIKGEITIIKSYQQVLKELIDSISDVSSSIEEVELAESLPGIGNYTASVLISEIGHISNFKNTRKITAFCGLDPAVKESGNFKGTKVCISKRGSSHIRRVLYQAAKKAVQKDGIPALRDYYQEKIKTKPKKVVLMAVMHKLIKYLYAVLRDRKPFRNISKEEHLKNYNTMNNTNKLAA